MTARAAAASLALVVAAACGRDAASPTGPTKGTEPTGRLTVTVDSLGSSVAIPAVSRVRFDATGSVAGEGPVQYLVDYGDHTSGSGQTTEHVYANPGTYTASITLVDARGRRASATRTVDVRAVQGEWFHAGYNTSTARVEIRRLKLTAQDGRTVSGEFAGPRGEPVPVNATLDGERTLRFSAAGTQVEGVVPSAVFADGAIIPFHGFAYPDAELRFAPILGEPSGPPPVAALDLRIDSYNSPAAILGLSPVHYSAAASTADRPTYVIEFGDGGFSTETTTVHPCTRSGFLTARVTVIDRFARSGAKARDLQCVDLSGYSGYWSYTPTYPEPYEHRMLSFRPHQDRNVEGFYRHPDGGVSHFSGVLTGERGIHLVLDGGGIEFTGEIIIGDPTWIRSMSLTLKGGSADGKTLRFSYAEPY